MIARFADADQGQALVIAALGMVVLMGALALTLDWGYGFASRRDTQNEADAAAFAAGRLLATSFVDVSQPFELATATEEQVWAAACAAARRNTGGTANGQSHKLEVWFSADPPTTPFSTGPTSTWTGIVAPSNDCSAVPAGTTAVPGDTVYVRVVSSASYLSLFGVPARQGVQVAASARVRLSGAGSSIGPGVVPLAPVGDSSVGIPGVGLSGWTTAPNVAMWPIVMHYDPSDTSLFATAGGEITLIDWESRRGQADNDLSAFISYAHFSPRERDERGVQVHQPITESDYSGIGNSSTFGSTHGHPLTGELPAVGNCPSGLWDTRGLGDSGDAASCDIPNWFYYGYRGSLSLGTDWDDTSWTRSFESVPQAAEMPDAFPASRASCASVASYPRFTAPSCDVAASDPSHIGDWVETITTGVNRVLVANEMAAFIDRYGRVDPSTGEKAVVVNVFLWDCGEQYDDEDSGNRWQLLGGADCSTLLLPQVRAADRVHLFAVVPVTIAASDVDVTQRRSRADVYVTGHWGNAFGEAGICRAAPATPGCAMNPLVNSAFLVPDE